MIQSVLFVCLGNICRSPTAEGVFRKLAETEELNFSLDSAGTSSWHVGDPPHPPMQKAAIARGYDLSDLRARQIRKHDFIAYDLILVMDKKNARAVERYRPEENTTPVVLFLDYAPDQPIREMPDPYFTKQFDLVIDLCEAASEGLLERLRKS